METVQQQGENIETDINYTLENIIKKIENTKDCDSVCKDELRQQLFEAIEMYEQSTVDHKNCLYSFLDNHMHKIIPGLGNHIKDKYKTNIQKLFWVNYFLHDDNTGENTDSKWRFAELTKEKLKSMYELTDLDFSLKFTENPKSDHIRPVPNESFLEWSIDYKPGFFEQMEQSGEECVLPYRITARVKNDRDSLDKFFDEFYGVDKYPITIPKSKVKSKTKREQLEQLEARAGGLDKQKGILQGLYDKLGARVYLPHIKGETQEEENELNKRQIEIVAKRIAASIDREWIKRGKKLSEYQVKEEDIPEPENRYQNQVLQVKDYVTNPKGNNYQSYHMNILYGGTVIELQLRTDVMHENAEDEKGWAGHEGRKLLAKLRREQFLDDPENKDLRRVYNTLNELLIPERSRINRYKTLKLPQY